MMLDGASEYLLGLDVGSTTAKAVLLRRAGGRTAVLASCYRRHEARVAEAARAVVAEATAQLPAGAAVRVGLTGSGAMGLAERAGLPFVQEVHALCAAAAEVAPGVRTLIDVGGEDSKLVFVDGAGRLDARMNGACAGGTGAFLDQIAALLRVQPAELEALAAAGRELHPVASRCGVFAKTDVQGLLSQGAARADVALSVFHAVANQVLTALGRGRTAAAPLLMTGGPLSFLPTLRRVFLERLRLGAGDAVLLEHGERACAHGAALAAGAQGATLAVPELSAALARAAGGAAGPGAERPLFGSAEERDDWLARRLTPRPRVAPAEVEGELYLGIDSGSTTTKLALVDARGRVAADAYEMNHGDPLAAARRGLDRLRAAWRDRPPPPVRQAAVTGYGEELLKAALGIELGLVETLAHLQAARALVPEVSFILDVGGQDMKALFIRDGRVERVEVNEACSSGCGSFLQTFAEALGLPVAGFAEAACRSRAPRALGSRCTVFMNSMVRQALREGAGVDDLAAGLAYAVVRNCLQKVLKLHDPRRLGPAVVVQGGTFLNPAVHRAFELLTGRRATCPEGAGLSGAYGAALWARDRAGQAAPRALASFAPGAVRARREVRCGGCENRCAVTLVDFERGGRHVSGNRCERTWGSREARARRGTNHLAEEARLLRGAALLPAGGRTGLRIGLPMALGMYEDLPFWMALLTGLGHEVVLSGDTAAAMVEAATDTVCSETVCLPARIASAHVVRLGEAGVDRILFPQVFREGARPGASASYTCPIVAGYPEVVGNTVSPERRGGVRLATPPVSFADPRALRRTVRRALAQAEIPARGFGRAFGAALRALERHRERREALGRQAVAEARARGRRLAVLACRPYHLDPYLHRGVPELLADLGYDVVSSQCLPLEEGALGQTAVLAQWAYPNRVLEAAAWVARQPDACMVQLNSFGCGPDAVVADEAAALLEHRRGAYALLRVDEATAPGSIRLRLRAMEAAGEPAAPPAARPPRRTTRAFTEADRCRTLLTAQMDPFLFSVLGAELGRLGHRVEVVPPTDQEALELGLRYTNNEICYPAILVIGDLLKALRSGRYPLAETGLILTQTGGQCRASNYVPLLKKALVSAGFAEVPVVTLQYGSDPLNEQPGFHIDRRRLLQVGLASVLVTDALAMMARALAAREAAPGQAWATAQRLVGEWTAVEGRDARAVGDFVGHACRVLSGVPVVRREAPRVGLVGEIYVKHSAFANRHLADWLGARGIEPVLPPLTSFFVQEPLNALVNRRAGLDRGWAAGLLLRWLDGRISGLLEDVNRRLEPFPFPVRFSTPRELAARAERVISLTHQYGEGWVLGGEVMEMAERGVRKVVCLQPFGCIANQVVARGIERRLRAAHPELDVLYLDVDHNTSEANLLNRVRLLVEEPRPAAAGVVPLAG